jgi:hypothetical protein
MKKLLTAALLISGSALSYGQMYNPYVNLSSINPSPLQPAEENGTGTLTFHVGNSGTTELFVPVSSPMYINVSLTKGIPMDTAALVAITNVSGTYANKFTWVYLSSLNAFQGTQVAPLPAGGDGTITINYKVTQNSSISLPQNGFNVNVVPPAYSNGFNTTTDDAINKYVYTVTVISGTVYNDVNGLTDLLVNGTGTNAGGTLNAVLINSASNVVAVVAVAADGTYAFPEVPNGNYDVMITTANPTVGGAAPAASVLPTNWVNTGEGVLPVGDGTANGLTSVVKPANSVTGVNFGIEERPTAGTSTTATFTNPGTTNTVAVPPASFTSTDPSTGTVTNIIITGFPTNVTGITINGIPYNSGNFPVGGVTVPAPGGVPTQPILIDPNDGGVIVVIPFKAVDNATFQSNNTGSVTVPFGVPLPLDLLAFNARKQGNVAIMNWETANESKVKAFEIERGTNGITFSYIGSVAAANGTKNAYDFTDRKPNMGANFYRLKMVDVDGKFTYSTIKQLEFTDTKMDLVLYPNPTTSELNIEFKSGNCGDVNHASVSVFDISGRMVISKPWDEVCNNPVKVVDLSQLTDGAYFITVRNSGNDEIILNKKIVKTK